MNDPKPNGHAKKQDLARGERRPYKKPAIEEEAAFETCAALMCGLKPGGTGNCQFAPGTS